MHADSCLDESKPERRIHERDISRRHHDCGGVCVFGRRELCERSNPDAMNESYVV